MQTFLPFVDFAESSAALDNRRLGKQRVETFQILRALTWPGYAWKNHPAVRMWRGFVPALVAYGLANCDEWTARGCVDSVRASLLEFSGGEAPDVAALARGGELPPWLGVDALHRSHRSALLRKEPARYRPLFGDLPDDLPYWWPENLFPRWPIRPAARCSPTEALALLGHQEHRAGQADTAVAVVSGADCLAVFPPGSGGRTAGLLAALQVDGVVWRSTDDAAPRGRFDHAERLPAREVLAPRCAVPAALTARQPGPEDLAAMAAEATPTRWRFLRPGQPPPAGRAGLIVVERADALGADERAAIAKARESAGHPPLLAVVRRADVRTRRRVCEELGLADPVSTAGAEPPAPVSRRASAARGR